MSIGVFDSGVGGLSVLKRIREKLPNEKIYYFGDTGRVPYGNKDKATIVAYCREIVEFLTKKDVDVIVVACNTATIMALEELQAEFSLPIIGVIEPGVDMAVDLTKNKKIGVIGTELTVKSQEHETRLKEKDAKIQVFSQACPLFVPAVEEGILEGRLVEEIVKMYLGEFAGEIDTLILGCTHYPLIEGLIRRIYPGIKLVDPGVKTAENLKKELDKLSKTGEKENKKEDIETEYFITGNAEKFLEVGAKFLGEKINLLEKIEF